MTQPLYRDLFGLVSKSQNGIWLGWGGGEASGVIQLFCYLTYFVFVGWKRSAMEIPSPPEINWLRIHHPPSYKSSHSYCSGRSLLGSHYRFRFIFLLRFLFAFALPCALFFSYSLVCVYYHQFFFHDVVCLACFRYFLDILFLFLNSRLIFAHISVQCAFLQL